MKTTTMYCPESPEDLVSLTLDAILDLRVREGLIDIAPEEDDDGCATPAFGPTRTSSSGYLAQRYQNLLPSKANNNVLLVRLAYGWTLPEIEEIQDLLRKTVSILRSQSDEVLLSGTAATLRRDADLVERLVDHWTP